MIGKGNNVIVKQPAPKQDVFGETLRRRVLPNFRFVESIYSPRMELPMHAHHLSFFCFVMDGRFTERNDRRSVLYQPHSLIFRPAGEMHANRVAHNETRCFTFHLEDNWLAQIRDLGAVCDRPLDLNLGAAIGLALKLYREFREFDDVSPLIMEGAILELLGEAARHSESVRQFNSAPAWLENVKKRVEQQFQESLSLQKLAQSAGVHPVYLARSFRRHYHCTVGDYLRRSRVHFACQRLSTSKIPIAQIATEAGFVDQSHFAKSFRKIIGTSPLQFRLSAFRG